MRRRILESGKNVLKGAVRDDGFCYAGDLVVYNKNLNQVQVVDLNNPAQEFPISDYTPIAVIVIPSSHNVYGTGEAAAMSLLEMNYTTPDSGSNTSDGMYWGQLDSNISELDDFDKVPFANFTYDQADSITKESNYASLPSDAYSEGTACKHDTNSFYFSGAIYAAPSPYLTNGSRNSMYHQITSPCSEANALSDFDGKSNTEVLTNFIYAGAQQDWRTADTIINNSDWGYSPAACCCARYHTEGTSQGDWYLPAMGELGYAISRLAQIEKTIQRVRDIVGDDISSSLYETVYWSSTESSSRIAAQIVIFTGMVRFNTKSTLGCVRAFIRIKPSVFGKLEPSTAPPLSVVFANKIDNNLVIAKNDKWDTTLYPPDTWEPIGIVVIPAYHGVLKDGTGTINQCGIISIKPMSYETPETGGTTEGTMYWGYNSLDISGKSDGLGRYDSVSKGLLNYQHVVTTADNTSNTANGYSSSSYAYIPRQGAIGGTPTRDRSPYAPSPYVGSDYKSGGYNESYGLKDEVVSTEANNALSDFKGIVNTKIITDLSDGWKSGAISNSYQTSGVYPAAQTCARYKTTGTKAFKDCTTEELKNGTGFWYLPAVGELGYIIPRLYDINDTISKLNDAYGVGVQVGTSNSYWLSSEDSSSSAYSVGTGIGSVGSINKNLNYRVRAFMRLSNANPETTYEYVDLGLSVLWATCNVGATSSESAGLYFKWGDTRGYTEEEVNSGLFKNSEYAEDQSDLSLDKDAANVKMGGDWRMPTWLEYQELINACNITWTTLNGINGSLFTLKSDNSKTLFFPAAGYAFEQHIEGFNVRGNYSTKIHENSGTSFYMYTINGETKVNTIGRTFGLTVRAVLDR